MVAETPQQAAVPAGAIVPVGQARSVAGLSSAADLESLKQVITQTRAIGIILPPPDIRAIIDKTAQFVAKNGLEFEKRILASEANNVKFNFLNPTDPYHAYYRMRVKNFQEPEEGKETDKDVTAAATPAAAAAAAVAAIPAAAVLPTPAPVTTRPLEKPEDEKYTVHVPEGLTALDLDIIKLTAQFVARNGAAFLTGLTQREGNNPQFYFLKPTHSMFGFFTSLADAYSAVLMPDKGLREKLAGDATDRSVILERCLKRLEWDKARAREAQELEDEQERERVAMQQIDWHDFVIVETIDFYEDEDEELPPPMSLKDLIKFNKDQQLGGPPEDEQAQEAAAAAAAAAGGEAMDTDQAGGELDDQERALLAAAAGAEGTPPVPDEDEEEEEEPEQQQPAAAGVTAAPEPPDEEMEDDMDMEDDEGPIKVVKNYKRHATAHMAMTAGGVSYDPTKFAVSPITGELIAHADMAEHMRISLLDPRWKEQKEAMLSKLKDTTRADDEEITRNLLGLAKTRPDIFGSTEEELAEVVTAAVKEKQTSGQGRAVTWDGQTTGGEYLRNQRQNIQDNRKELGSSIPSGADLLPPLPQAGPTTTGSTQQQQQQQRMGGGPAGMGMRPPPPVMGMMRPPPPMGMGGPGGMPPPLSSRPPLPGSGMTLPPPPGPPAAAAGVTRPAEDDGAAAAAKRPRVDFVLTAEDDFLAQIGDRPSKVRIQCPEIPGSDKLIGQMLEVEVATLRDAVGDLKARLESVTGLAVNKQKLNREGVGFLRDEFSLAHYNVSPDVILVLGTKERGGRKK